MIQLEAIFVCWDWFHMGAGHVIKKLLDGIDLSHTIVWAETTIFVNKYHMTV